LATTPVSDSESASRETRNGRWPCFSEIQPFTNVELNLLEFSRSVILVDMEEKPRTAYCSFCRKSYQEVGPLVEGPPFIDGRGNVYICGSCIELCQSIFKQEVQRRDSKTKSVTTLQFSNYPIGLLADSFTCRRDDLYDNDGR